MPQTYLLLGTNLGNKTQNLINTTKLLTEKVGKVHKRSSIYETMPWGIENQPVFYNQVICLETELNPEQLLIATQNIEKELGRVRVQKWAERLIDIDILYYEKQIYETEKLKIPHPQIQNRNFTLAPLVEIASDLIHPVLELSQKKLLETCKDNLEVKKLNINLQAPSLQ